jgi:hypothetical protein
MQPRQKLTRTQAAAFRERSRRRKSGEVVEQFQSEVRVRYWTDLLGEELRERLIALVHAELRLEKAQAAAR